MAELRGMHEIPLEGRCATTTSVSGERSTRTTCAGRALGERYARITLAVVAARGESSGMSEWRLAGECRARRDSPRVRPIDTGSTGESRPRTPPWAGTSMGGTLSGPNWSDDLAVGAVRASACPQRRASMPKTSASLHASLHTWPHARPSPSRDGKMSPRRTPHALPGSSARGKSQRAGDYGTGNGEGPCLR